MTARKRYVVRPRHAYARPDGGRLAKWAVVDTWSLSRCQDVESHQTRAEARAAAAALNRGAK